MTLGTIEHAIRRTAGELVYFIGTISTDKIKLSTFVPVIEDADTYLSYEVDEGNYQRPGTKSRMNLIKKYFHENPNRLVPPIILSGRGNWKFSGSGVTGSISVEGRAAIIDGQHRAGGLVALYEQESEPREIDFVCFENLSLEEEIEEFVTINGEQKGVPKPLNTFLKGGDDVEIAWTLNLHEDSPFRDKIFRVRGDANTYYALHSMARNVKDTFNNGAFLSLNVDSRVEALIMFWKLIAKHNSEAWKDIERPKRQQEMKLCELTGIIAWSSVGAQVLLKGWAPESKTFNWDEIEKVIEFVSEDIDWSKTGDYDGLTGQVGGRRIAIELESALGHYQRD
jgi:DGQHR domain-containing protein